MIKFAEQEDLVIRVTARVTDRGQLLLTLLAEDQVILCYNWGTSAKLYARENSSAF